MYVFAIFELSLKTEEAVTALEVKGIKKEAILVVPMNSRNESKNLFDTVHYSDNTSILVFPIISATLSTFLGCALGFQMYWGPILWGVIGALAGFILGLCISLPRAIYKKHHQHKAPKGNVVIVVNCDKTHCDLVQDILWSNAATGVNVLE